MIREGSFDRACALAGSWGNAGSAGRAAAELGSALRRAAAYLSMHTGLPTLVVAALAIVVGFRLLRWTVRIAVELCVVLAVLLALTRLGWIRW